MRVKTKVTIEVDVEATAVKDGDHVRLLQDVQVIVGPRLAGVMPLGQFHDEVQLRAMRALEDQARWMLGDKDIPFASR